MSGHRSFATALAVLFLAAPLAAQGVASNATVQQPGSVTTPVVVAAPATDAASAPSLAPTRVNATAGVHAVAVPAAPLYSAPPSTVDRNPAMMIVGGAALLVGAVVGGRAGTIVMIVGGTIGLVGLWRYLQ